MVPAIKATHTDPYIISLTESVSHNGAADILSKQCRCPTKWHSRSRRFGKAQVEFFAKAKINHC